MFPDGEIYAAMTLRISRSSSIASKAAMHETRSAGTREPAIFHDVKDVFVGLLPGLAADRFDSYDGQKLELTGEHPALSGIIVKSQIIKASGEPSSTTWCGAVVSAG